MRRRSVVIPPPPDRVEPDELPPDPGPRWPDPPGPRVPPEPARVVDGCIFGGDYDPDLLDLVTGSGSGSVDTEALTRADLDRLLAEIDWDRDAAERALFGLDAPEWASAPPGPELAAALDRVRVSTTSPAGLIELMKAATRLQAWTEALTATAMATFWHHRQAEAAARAESGDPNYDNQPARHDPMRGAAHEIAAALRLAPRTALARVDAAVRLARDLPDTYTALRTGRITMTKATVILDATEHLSPDNQRAVQDRVLKRAPNQTRGQLHAACRRAAVAIDPDGENERHQRAKKNREITVRPLPDGMAQLIWTDSAHIIQTAWIVLSCLADAAKANPAANADRPGSTPTGNGAASRASTPATTPADGDGAPTSTSTDNSTEPSGHGTGTITPPTWPDSLSDLGLTSATDAASDTASDIGREPAGNGESNARPAPDRRTADQRRCDAAADLFRVLLDRGTDWFERSFPTQHRRRAHIEVLVPLTVLLGIREDPCELAGYGPIPSDLARRIAAQGTWRRLLTDPATGLVLEASTHRHDPPAQVSETVLARDQTCRGIGCRMPARLCDRDHGSKFKNTLRTHLHDLSAICRSHHLVKDDDTSGWTMQQQPDATIDWTAPTGHTYTTEPPPLGPIADTDPASSGSGHRRPPDDPPPF